MPKINKKLVLGITGGIASGKSTALALIAKSGIPVISSDELAHRAIVKGSPLYRRILKRYGRTLLDASSEIRRGDLGKIVFRHPAERRWLEKQIHPVVIRELKNFIRKHSGVMALDIPLLFEVRLQPLVDLVVVVYCSPAQQLARLQRRNGYSKKEAVRRLQAQWPMAKKRTQADVVLQNNQSRSKLRKEVQTFLNSLVRR